jgi:hypothetical protein
LDREHGEYLPMMDHLFHIHQEDSKPSQFEG